MDVFFLRLSAPRPDFAASMTDAERAIMDRHSEYWEPYLESGRVVVQGPTVDETGTWGLTVVEADDEEALREFIAGDPAVTAGLAEWTVGKMIHGYVRSASS